MKIYKNNYDSFIDYKFIFKFNYYLLIKGDNYE